LQIPSFFHRLLLSSFDLDLSRNSTEPTPERLFNYKRVVKNGFCQRYLVPTNEQQCHFSELPIIELYGEADSIDSIQTSLKLLLPSSNNGMSFLSFISGFKPTILRPSGILGAADDAVLNNLQNINVKYGS
jgi:hypothetical protein